MIASNTFLCTSVAVILSTCPPTSQVPHHWVFMVFISSPSCYVHLSVLPYFEIRRSACKTKNQHFFFYLILCRFALYCVKSETLPNKVCHLSIGHLTPWLIQLPSGSAARNHLCKSFKAQTFVWSSIKKKKKHHSLHNTVAAHASMLITYKWVTFTFILYSMAHSVAKYSSRQLERLWNITQGKEKKQRLHMDFMYLPREALQPFSNLFFQVCHR